MHTIAKGNRSAETDFLSGNIRGANAGKVLLRVLPGAGNVNIILTWKILTQRCKIRKIPKIVTMLRCAFVTALLVKFQIKAIVEEKKWTPGQV
jgi:hypothetical protein